jgi:hypothetical protein
MYINATRKHPESLSKINKNILFFSFSKTENKKAREVLPGGWYQ